METTKQKYTRYPYHRTSTLRNLKYPNSTKIDNFRWFLCCDCILFCLQKVARNICTCTELMLRLWFCGALKRVALYIYTN